MSKVSFDSQDEGDRCLELALAVRLSRVSRRKKDDFAHSGNCKVGSRSSELLSDIMVLLLLLQKGLLRK